MDTSRKPAPQQNLSDPSLWLDQHGDALYRYALQRVRNRDIAEELVQETLLAAFGSYREFEGRSSLRTWLVAIIRRKIVDYIRDSAGQNREPIGEPDGSEVSAFNLKGKWNEPPGAWPRNTDVAMENEEFWAAFDKCFGGLSRPLADAFCLCELENINSQEVCQVLGISASNLWTRLHRARLLLRRCLEIHLFSLDSPGI